MRASQINGCAYCIDLHTKDTRSHGEREQRLYALDAWHETLFYLNGLADLGITAQVHPKLH